MKYIGLTSSRKIQRVREIIKTLRNHRGYKDGIDHQYSLFTISNRNIVYVILVNQSGLRIVTPIELGKLTKCSKLIQYGTGSDKYVMLSKQLLGISCNPCYTLDEVFDEFRHMESELLKDSQVPNFIIEAAFVLS